MTLERQIKISWSLKTRGLVENVHFSLQLLNKTLRCTFIDTANCDEQHALYRIVLT